MLHLVADAWVYAKVGYKVTDELSEMYFIKHYNH